MIFDFDRRQFRLLMRLLSDLGARRELTSQFGFDQHAIFLSGGFGLFVGGLLALSALGRPGARAYMMTALGITAFWLLPRIVSQAADAFMNPAEVAVLAHRPIHAGSYVAAKAAYVARAALVVTLPLNLIPALAGVSLPGTRWFYPLTHLAAVAAASLFTTLVVCGVLGVVFRALPIGAVRTAALWAQLLSVMIVPLSPQLLNAFRVPLDLDARAWSAIPVTWFAALGLAGQMGRPPLDVRIMLPVLAGAFALIVLGARSLTQDYMTRVSTMMRIQGARKIPTRAGRLSRLTTGFRSGGQATRAGTAFVRALAFRDWQFRRMFLGGSVGIVILFAVGIGRNFAKSPLQVPTGGRLTLLPLMLGVLMLNASMALAFTDRPLARWIFLMAPTRGLRGIVRGMYWGLWQPLVAVPHVVLFIAGTLFWGLSDALLFSTYSMSISSLYLGAGLWLADGLPFTKQADPNRPRALMGVMVMYLLSAAGLAAFQDFWLFRHAWLLPVATTVLAAGAWVAAEASFRVLDSRVLQGLNEGSRGIFKQFEDPVS